MGAALLLHPPLLRGCPAAPTTHHSHHCSDPKHACTPPIHPYAHTHTHASFLQDDDPYVRKTAAVCVAKLFDINPDLVEDRGFLDMLRVRQKHR